MSTPNVSVPQWTPTPRELDDLDLLVNQSFEPPLSGFVDPTVTDGLPITLVVSAEVAEIATGVGALDLIDPEGAPLARLTVAGTWEPAGNGQVGLVGAVETLAHNEFGPFRPLHVAPADFHRSHPADTVLAVPVTRALTDRDLESIASAAREQGRTPLLLAAVGDGMPDELSGPALVRATLTAARLLGSGTQVVAVSVADHAVHQPADQETGRTATATPVQSVNSALLASVASAYARSVHILSAAPHGSRTAAIEAIVAKDRPPRDRQGVVIFFTGLSGSGKSTLARALVDHILEQGERTITSLDGDVVRHHLSKGLGFSREDRETNILRIGYVAAEISRHGGLAVCSPIAPFESTRAEVKAMVERAGGGFVLIHVATPLEECERRDRKGLYAKARAGEIPDFTGISSPYEEPRKALKVDTTDRNIAECLEEILDALVAEGWLAH